MTALEDASRVRPWQLLSWRGLIALALSISALVFLATSFDPEFGAVRERIVDSDAGLLLLAFTAHYLSLVVRGYRWRLMLLAARDGAAEPDDMPSGLRCGVYLLLGWFVNAVSWLRLGTAYRAFLAADAAGGFARSLGIVLAERVLDLSIVLVLLALAGLLLLTGGDGAAATPFLLTAVIFLGGLALVLLVARQFRPRLILCLPRRMQDAWFAFQGSAVLSLRLSRLPLTVLLSLVAWGLEGARIWLVVLALGLDVSPEMVLFLTFAQGLLISLPLTPGGLGVVEPGLTGLLLLSFDHADAVSITLLDRAISYVSVVVLGGIVFVARESLPHLQRFRPTKAAPLRYP